MSLEEIAKWRVARSRLMLDMAQGSKDDLFGMRPSKANSEQLWALWNEYEERQAFIAQAEPTMMATVREMLRVCCEILACREFDPDSRLADGPVLQILRNCTGALDWLPSQAPVGNPKERQARLRLVRRIQKDRRGRAG